MIREQNGFLPECRADTLQSRCVPGFCGDRARSRDTVAGSRNQEGHGRWVHEAGLVQRANKRALIPPRGCLAALQGGWNSSICVPPCCQRKMQVL